MPLPLIVLATHNVKKGRELYELLAPRGMNVRTLADFGESIDVVEDGETFGENARLKAVQQARHLDQWVIAEDSGLVVVALSGAPGVYSARYSGEGATDQSNNMKLMEELGETPLELRSARYVCHATCCDPQGTVRAESEASCNGRIRFTEAGTAGFGYDPLFEIVEYHQTFAQLGDSVKSVLSHRARAIRELIPKLLAIDPSA